MIVLYDEHGGFYDHVFPKPAVPPTSAPAGPGLFRFDRLGGRVPAVVVSPPVERGALDRDAAAPALDTLLTRSTPRLGEAEAPWLLARPAVEAPVQPWTTRKSASRAAGPRRERRLNDVQQNLLQLLAHARALEAARARGKRAAGTRTVGESVAYLAGARPAAARLGAGQRGKRGAKKAKQPRKRRTKTARSRRATKRGRR